MAIFIQVDFTDTEGTAYKIEFSDATYVGAITQVQGRATLDYPKVKTMDMLRGSTLKIELEASITDTYYTRLIETVGDKKLPVTLYKDGAVFWNGFVKPDGIVESFVYDYWVISIQAIDGLGLIDNIKFLDADGEKYAGNMSELAILARCLELTGQTMNFHLYYFNLYYTTDDLTDAVITNKAIKTTYVNTDRYKKNDDKKAVFTVKEVLESLLKKYGAFVTQQNNSWHVVRLIDYWTGSAGIKYDIYTYLGVAVTGNLTIDPRTVLGSEIDSYYPHHAGGNQQKNYDVALGAYKVTYTYGTTPSIIQNQTLFANDNLGDIDSWTIINLTWFNFIAKDPTTDYPTGYYCCAFIAKNIFGGLSSAIALKTDITVPSTVSNNSSLTLDISAEVTQRNEYIIQYVQIALIGDGGTTYYLSGSGEWGTGVNKVKLFSSSTSTNRSTPTIFEINSNIQTTDTKDSGTIEISFYQPEIDIEVVAGYTEYENTIIITNVNLSGQISDIKGESHTAQRVDNVTAVIESTDKIYVGDNNSDLYIGGIETASDENTIAWSKASPLLVIDDTKKYKLLQWLVIDRLRISSGNATIFKGGIYGYLPYLGVLTLAGIDGIYMTIGWSHNLNENKISGEFQRIFVTDIEADTIWTFDYEGVNVIEPAIE